MKTLKEEFEKEIRANKDGISVLFETSNQKYIEWLENKIAKILSPSEPEQKKPLSDELKSLDIVIRCHKDMIGLSTTPKEDKKVLNDLIKIRSFIKNK